jgi:hypothetical protein
LRAPGVGGDDGQRGLAHIVAETERAQASFGECRIGREALLRRIDEALDQPIAAIKAQRACVEQGQNVEALTRTEREILGRPIGRIGPVGGEICNVRRKLGARRVIGQEAR